MKSLAVSVFWPCWEWLTWPERRWLFSSYALSLSIRDSLKCRRLIQSPWYQEQFGHIYQLTGDQNAKMRFENDRTGYRIATSVGGAATGEGGDRIVCDDPHNVEQAESETIREHTLTWWDHVMSTRGNDPKTVARVIVMQRVHENDLSGHVLAKGGYDHLCLPAKFDGRRIVTSIGWQDPRTGEGDLLWDQRFGQQEIADLERDLGSYSAAGQLQQRPSPAEGGILKRQWWRYWQRDGQTLPPVLFRQPGGEYDSHPVVTLPDAFDEVIQSWDMAFKDTKASAYVVGQVWGRKGADVFLLHQVRDKMDFVATVSAVRTLSQDWPQALGKLVEDKANGPAVMDALRHEIAGLIPVEPDGSKEARMHAASPFIEAGNVYIPHPSIALWVDGFVNEAAMAPNGAYMDQVDTMTQAVRRLIVSGPGQGIWF